MILGFEKGEVRLEEERCEWVAGGFFFEGGSSFDRCKTMEGEDIRQIAYIVKASNRCGGLYKIIYFYKILN